MQVRVLDHKRFIEAMHLPTGHQGRVTVGVQESEGSESRFQVDLSEGRAAVSPYASSPGFVCRDRVWAAIVCGDLPATRAVQLGLATAEDFRTAQTLDVFSMGPAPFCHEYF